MNLGGTPFNLVNRVKAKCLQLPTGHYVLHPDSPDRPPAPASAPHNPLNTPALLPPPGLCLWRGPLEGPSPDPHMAPSLTVGQFSAPFHAEGTSH